MRRERIEMKSIYITLILCLVMGIILLLHPEQGFSQPPPILPDNPEQTPIDGGLGILAALGGAYAIKKLREKE